MLAEKAKQIAEEEKRLRELKEKGESDIPPPPTPDRQAVQPRRVPGSYSSLCSPLLSSTPARIIMPAVVVSFVGKTTVIAPVAGPAPEGEPEAAPSTLRRGPDGELVMDRSEYDAQNRYVVVLPPFIAVGPICLPACVWLRLTYFFSRPVILWITLTRAGMMTMMEMTTATLAVTMVEMTTIEGRAQI